MSAVAQQGFLTCGSCQTTAWPQMTLLGGKLQPACPQCSAMHQGAEVEDFQRGAPVDANSKPLPVTEIARPAVRLVAPLPASVAPPRALEPLDIVQAVRDRMVFLGSEEARLEGVAADTNARLAGVRAEAKKLRKMMLAADRT